MAKNRKIPTAVRHQVNVTRAQEIQEPGEATISPREALTQARMAGRKARNEAIAARLAEQGAQPAKPIRPQTRVKPIIEHRLSMDGLVTLSKPTIGFRVGATIDPYIPLQKGAVGMLVARNIWHATRDRSGRRSRPGREELCHVMLPAGIVELPVSVVRDCGSEESEG